MTPDRLRLLEAILSSKTITPAQLRTSAVAWEKEGFADEATLMRKRADLREESPEKKKERADIFRKALSSANPTAVRRVADIFEQQGATGAAATVRRYAAGLEQSQAHGAS